MTWDYYEIKKEQLDWRKVERLLKEGESWTEWIPFRNTHRTFFNDGGVIKVHSTSGKERPIYPEFSDATKSIKLRMAAGKKGSEIKTDYSSKFEPKVEFKKDLKKADFSFRDVIKNSRGVYAGIFDRIQMTPDLSKLGGAVLGDALKVVEGIEGMTVADKRKAAEVVLMEPILIGLDMMNDPSMEKELDNLMEMRVTQLTQEGDEEDGEGLSPEQMDTIQQIADKSVNAVRDEMKNSIDETLSKKFGEELLGAEKMEVMEGIREVISSQEFIGYIAVLLNALISKVAKESKEKAKESDNEVEVNPDEDFPQSFYERERTIKSWFDNVKR